MSDDKVIEKNLVASMKKLRELVENGHSIRKENKIKLRQPLSKFAYGHKVEKLPEELESLLMEELNVKRVEYSKDTPTSFDFKLSSDLLSEGEARDIVRQIQRKRKEANCKMDEEVVVQLPKWPKDFENYIKKETITRELVKAEELKVIRN